MSKSLKKLIDINRLREFKNKLVGTDSPYVQTGAVDQTIAGTKTFSKPIAGSVTGSSGSCTGNAATATTATTAKSCTGNAASANIATKATQDAAGNTITTTYATKAENNTKANNSEVVHKSGDETIAGTKTFSNGVLSTAVNAFMAQNKGYTVLLRNDGGYTYLLISDKDAVPGTWSSARPFVISNSTGVCSINGNASTATTATTAKACTGNAATATKLQTARTINGTNFDGTANITTANWGTARNISITDGTNTSTAVSVNGSANVSLNLPATIKANLTGNCSGSSGSCTGNAATATTATTAKACTGNAATATKLQTARSLWGNSFDGSAAITGLITGTPAIELMPAATSNMGGYLDFHYNHSTADYTSRIIESASGTLSINGVTITTGKVVTAATFNGALKGNVTGNCSGSSGSCTGNAATATTATTATDATYANWLRTSSHSDHLFHTEWDGAGYFWTYVTAGNGDYRSVRVARSDSSGYADTAAKLVQWYAAYPDGAEAHNAMWGGRDITAAFDAGTVSANIANGTFRDIFPGDYITKQVTISGTTYTVNWVIADCDYWWHKGDQNNVMETHHVAIVPQAPIFNANMNATNTAEGGYASSRMYRETIPACAKGLVSAFGSSHILTFRDLLTTDLNTSAVSSGITIYTGAPNWNTWYSQQCNLMSEAMVYDGPHCASSALDNIMATRQMSAFRLSERLINYDRHWWWLRDVTSSSGFAVVGGDGGAGTLDASAVGGVRLFALLV